MSSSRHQPTRWAVLTLLAASAVPATAAIDADPAAADAGISASADASDTDEVFVTARHRAEASQEVPLAVSVVGGEHIDNTGSFNVGRLQQLTPTLQFYSSNPRNSSVNVRGLGVPFGLTNDGIEQGVGIYVDDVYYSRVASATFDFLDVKQIELLRGPQGTLYGKNTTAGAINITTRAPTFDVEGRAEYTAGNLGFQQAKGALSGPLSPTVAGRLALSYTKRDGTIYNTTTRQHINDQDNLGLRGQLLWTPVDNLEVTLAGDYSQQNPNCCGTVFVRTGATQRALARQYAALAAAQNYTVVSRNPYDRLADIDADLNAGNKLGGASVRINWDVAGGKLTAVSAWRFWDWKPANDRDFTGLPITTLSQNPSQQNQYTQELRFAGGTERVDYVVGLFGFKQQVRTQGLQQQGPAASRWLLTGALANDPTVLDGLTAKNNIALDNTSAALFGQLSYHLTDTLTFQPGVRFNYDKKDGAYNSVVTNGAGQAVTFASTNARIVAQRGVLAPQSFTADFSDWNFGYDVNLSWQLAEDALGYLNHAQSFKSGGINLNGVPADAAGNPLLAAATVKPEAVKHTELGLKQQFLDRKLTLNVALFRTDIGDYQALVTNGQLGVLRGYLANAKKVRSQGAEVDFSYRPNERFNVYVNAAYTDATYRQFVDAPCPPELSGGGTGAVLAVPGVPGNSPANCNISGAALPGVSKIALSFGAEANLPTTLFGKTGELYFGYEGSKRSRFSSNPTPSAYTWVDGYALSNFRAGFRADQGVELFLWVRNAFDKDYIDLLQVPSGNTGLIVGNPGDPRTFGATIKYAF